MKEMWKFVLSTLKEMRGCSSTNTGKGNLTTTNEKALCYYNE